jgi:S-adenosylmethionine:tRNA ribosyltransferase-isomerase
MQLSQFDFELPKKLIAHYPTERRSESRLLSVNCTQTSCQHHQFTDLQTMLRPGDLLVLNDSKVFPARLFGQKTTGGKIELFVERILDAHHVLAHIRASKAPKIGASLLLEQVIEAEVLERTDDLFKVVFHGEQTALALLQQYGHIPLPPYIHRDTEPMDKERYQTVYAKHEGSVAAPTAGLHFDHEFLKQLQQQGIEQTYVTLHVGAGTFQPVRSENITQHLMHQEYVEVSAETCEHIKKTRARGGRIIAVGTTSVRCLETAAQIGEILPYQGETRLFIYPGYTFRCVDALLTNFHLPQSSLLMLVCAFGGYDLVMHAYQQAIAGEYRFFSYGDAMFLFSED